MTERFLKITFECTIGQISFVCDISDMDPKMKRGEFRRVFGKKLNPYLFRRIENSLFFNVV